MTTENAKPIKIVLIAITAMLLAFSTLLPLLTANADTVTQDTEYEQYYTAFSNITLVSKRTDIYNKSTSIYLPTYFQKELPEGTPPSALNDTAQVQASQQDNTLLYRAVTHSYPRLYTYWRHLEDLSNNVVIGTLIQKNQASPYNMLKDWENIYIDSNYKIKLQIKLEAIPLGYNQDVYNGDEFTYSQPYVYDNVVDVTTNTKYYEIIDADIVFNALGIGGQKSLYIKSLTIDVIKVTDITSSKPLAIHFKTDAVYSLIKQYYETDFEQVQVARYLSNQAEDNAMGLLFSPVTAFLRTEIAPNITFGTLVLVAIAIAVLGFSLKVMSNA